MPLAISNILWSAALEDEALLLAAAEKADGIEVAPTRLAPWDELTDSILTDYKKKLADHGFVIPSLQALLFAREDALLLGDEDSYRKFRAHMKRVAQIGATLGARRLVFGAPKNRRREAMPMTEAMARATERLYPVAQDMEDEGVTLVLEAVPEAYGGDFIVNAREAETLVRAVGHKGLRLHLDMGALEMARENPAEIVQDTIDILAHVHLSRPMLGPVTANLQADTAMDKALFVAAYSGWISIEIKPQPDALDQLRASISYARRTFVHALGGAF